MQPSLQERKRAHALRKNRERQTRFRATQKEKANLKQIQVRMSRYSHRLMRELAEKNKGLRLTDIYIKAIAQANLDNPPERHKPIIEGDDIGTCPICPWVPKKTADRFYKLAANYKSTTTAMSAIIYQYCMSQ